MVHSPPGRHSVLISVTPVAKRWPAGQVKETRLPKVVSMLELIAPSPAARLGQSALQNKFILMARVLQMTYAIKTKRRQLT